MLQYILYYIGNDTVWNILGDHLLKAAPGGGRAVPVVSPSAAPAPAWARRALDEIVMRDDFWGSDLDCDGA